MRLNEIFEKDINRTIDGVIKADDLNSLRVEIEEYVLTNEIEKHLSTLLFLYKEKNPSQNGVWISGFYGSGKSHLLKMLAYLLEDKQLENKSFKDYFVEKVKNDELLKSEIKKSLQIPSRSILFNIDVKADTNKEELDALLGVFLKVFNEYCGYHATVPFIANFERELEIDGYYESFQNHFKSISKKDWKTQRDRYFREQDTIDKAYSLATEKEIKNILEHYKSNNSLSIEDFAKMVKNHIDLKGDQFRLNFFVDEVGQYISGNTKLMTNLQSIAESLSTHCKGRSWLFVTAQEDMEAVLGEMTKETANDFTKIMARFSIRLKMSSQDVAEVIQKRLLSKKDSAREQLNQIYNSQKENFRTLFDFRENSRTFQIFKNEDNFLYSYPFIIYQYDLFQTSIKELSVHNAFEGKHSSVGERSLLGVFHSVLKSIQQLEVGKLATFDLMFEGIRTVLKTQIQSSILQAENHLSNKFAVKVLKALFLVKYIREFKASISNLSILLLDEFKKDLPELRSSIEDALTTLESETYIQRIGDTYVYLSNEEKDVESEIKNEIVTTQDMKDFLSERIYKDIITETSFRFEITRQNYLFTRKLDSSAIGREQDIAINILTFLSDDRENIFMERMVQDELLLILPTDPRLINNINLYLMTKKYIAKTNGTNLEPGLKYILGMRDQQNKDRIYEIEKSIRDLLSKAKMYVKGKELEITHTDSKHRIIQGFQSLIEKVYTNLRMLGGRSYLESQVTERIDTAQDGLYERESGTLTEAEREVLQFIKQKKTEGIRISIKSVLDKFDKKPYGWRVNDTLFILTSLFGRGLLELRKDSNVLDQVGLKSIIFNSSSQDSIMIEPLSEIDTQTTQKLKEFMVNFFNFPSNTLEGKQLAKDISEKFKNLNNELMTHLQRSHEFLFLSQFPDLAEKIQTLCDKPYSYFYEPTFLAEMEGLTELKSSSIDPIQKFFSSNQVELYRSTLEFLSTSRSNLRKVKDTIERSWKEKLSSIEILSKSAILRELKQERETLETEIANLLKEEREKALREIKATRLDIESKAEYIQLLDESKQKVLSRFQSIQRDIENESIITETEALRNRFITSISSFLLEVVRDDSQARGEDTTPTKPSIHWNEIRLTSYNRLKITSESELDEYIEKLKMELLSHLQSGKEIIL